MKLLSLDVSSKTGYCIMEDEKLLDFNKITVKVENFNPNSKPPPDKHPSYPKNIADASDLMASKIKDLILEVKPDHIVIENTVKGRNRNSQRMLEWFHRALLDEIWSLNIPFTYMDPSQWRSILELRLSKDDKVNNKMCSKGLKRGKVGKKHLSVRYINAQYNLKLKLKDNDQADSICLAEAWFKSQKP